ncbi:MAG: tetratricopeptide repeat protein, partial [Candidatus Binataceae bacterium]
MLSAESICQFILESEPGRAEALELLAEICFIQDRFEEALVNYERAFALRRNDADIAYNLGTVQMELKRYSEALSSYDRAIEIEPRHAAALINRGNVLQMLGRYIEAVRNHDEALLSEPDNAEAYFNRANALLALERHDEALASYERALAINARHGDALINRGNALSALNRHDEALASYEQAIAISPNRVDAHYDRGNALRTLARDAEAIASYDKAITIQPSHTDAHWNRAWALLALGDFERGWEEYEWRWRTEYAKHEYRAFGKPLWTGTADSADKTVLIHTEQGLGDTLQFIRYVPLAAQRCGRVILEVQRPLLRICERFSQWAQLVPFGEPIASHDFQCPMLSLPLAFRTTPKTIPADVPYIFANPELVEKWRERLLAPPRAMKVGLVWAGNPRQKSEPRRAVGLKHCTPLFAVPDVRWFSLQVGERAANVQELAPGKITDLSAHLTDFAETAAAIANLDLVVTTDTAVAHLAGAM